MVQSANFDMMSAGGATVAAATVGNNVICDNRRDIHVTCDKLLENKKGLSDGDGDGGDRLSLAVPPLVFSTSSSVRNGPKHGPGMSRRVWQTSENDDVDVVGISSGPAMTVCREEDEDDFDKVDNARPLPDSNGDLCSSSSSPDSVGQTQLMMLWRESMAPSLANDSLSLVTTNENHQHLPSPKPMPTKPLTTMPSRPNAEDLPPLPTDMARPRSDDEDEDIDAHRFNGDGSNSFTNNSSSGGNGGNSGVNCDSSDAVRDVELAEHVPLAADSLDFSDGELLRNMLLGTADTLPAGATTVVDGGDNVTSGNDGGENKDAADSTQQQQLQTPSSNSQGLPGTSILDTLDQMVGASPAQASVFSRVAANCLLYMDSVPEASLPTVLDSSGSSAPVSSGSSLSRLPPAAGNALMAFIDTQPAPNVPLPSFNMPAAEKGSSVLGLNNTGYSSGGVNSMGIVGIPTTAEEVLSVLHVKTVRVQYSTPSPVARPPDPTPTRATIPGGGRYVKQLRHMSTWVKCEACEKWRHVPEAHFSLLLTDGPFTCSMTNQWLNDEASCDAQQDPTVQPDHLTECPWLLKSYEHLDSGYTATGAPSATAAAGVSRANNRRKSASALLGKKKRPKKKETEVRSVLCLLCRELKPLTKEHFSQDREHPTGFRTNFCKACMGPLQKRKRSGSTTSGCGQGAGIGSITSSAVGTPNWDSSNADGAGCDDAENDDAEDGDGDDDGVDEERSTCGMCGVEKPLNSTSFQEDISGNGSFDTSICISCRDSSSGRKNSDNISKRESTSMDTTELDQVVSNTSPSALTPGGVGTPTRHSRRAAAPKRRWADEMADMEDARIEANTHRKRLLRESPASSPYVASSSSSVSLTPNTTPPLSSSSTPVLISPTKLHLTSGEKAAENLDELGFLPRCAAQGRIVKLPDGVIVISRRSRAPGSSAGGSGGNDRRRGGRGDKRQSALIPDNCGGEPGLLAYQCVLCAERVLRTAAGNARWRIQRHVWKHRHVLCEMMHLDSVPAVYHPPTCSHIVEPFFVLVDSVSGEVMEEKLVKTLPTFPVSFICSDDTEAGAYATAQRGTNGKS